MKIREVITEQPSSYKAGKALAAKVTSPSTWGLGGDTDYEGGKNFVNKILDPSQWFKGGNTPAAQTQTVKQTDRPSDPNQLDLGDTPPHQIRANLDNIISGQYYSSEKSTAKLIYDQISKGTYKPTVDTEATLGSLKKVINDQSLTDEDKETIKKLKASIKNIN